MERSRGRVPRRCSEFAPSSKCATKTVKKHFCIDRFEFPNKQGEQPTVMKSFYRGSADVQGPSASASAADSEWTLACEGQEHLPYPYGMKRDAKACNIDRPHPDVNEKALATRRHATRRSRVSGKASRAVRVRHA